MTAVSRRFEGKVKWYNIAKGFGFIICDDLAEDVFVHYENAPKCKKVGTKRLFEGQIVSFEIAKNGSESLEAFAVEIEQPYIYA
jgi:CspA family cold shock protein